MPNTTSIVAHFGPRLHGNLGRASRWARVFEPGHTGGGTSTRRTVDAPSVITVEHGWRFGDHGDHTPHRPYMRL